MAGYSFISTGLEKSLVVIVSSLRSPEQEISRHDKRDGLVALKTDAVDWLAARRFLL
jgi:hypothetical protein